MSIDLREDGRNFVIAHTDEHGVETRLTISTEDVLALARSAKQLEDHILAKHSSKAGVPRMTAVSAVPVAGGRITFDPFHGEVLLIVREQNDHEVTLSIPVDVARSLHQELPRWIGEAERAAEKKQAN